MDRKIEKKTWNSKRIMIIAGITAFVAFLVIFVIPQVTGKSKYNVPV
ncbi:MAG: efflux transporter periplasmic adaptor subunit, partial [Bacteroidetes bacterium]|nr:efflux transporter periplasmic adaptor subunit [Bacteroidota bacterium]